MNARLEGGDAEQAVGGSAGNGRTLLTADYMIDLHFSGLSYAEVGAWFGIDADFAYQIVREGLKYLHQQEEEDVPWISSSR